MSGYALCYLAFALVFGALDFVWLSLAGKHLYQPALGELLAEKVRIAPAVLFYVLYVAGAVFFAAGPALNSGDWRQAALRGAFFGLVAYATYDLTNQATLKIWSTRVTLADLAWGTAVTAVSAAVSVVVTYRASKALGWR